LKTQLPPPATVALAALWAKARAVPEVVYIGQYRPRFGEGGSVSLGLLSLLEYC